METTGIGNNSNISESSFNGLMGKTGSSELGEEDFLNLLVTQLTHQDPLEPLGNTEFIAQLSQFSSIEQLRGIKQLLEYNQLYLASINNSQAVNLIGKSVLVSEDALVVNDGSASPIKYDLSDDASEVTITIYDENGKVIKTKTFSGLNKGNHFYQWDGKDSDGNSVSDGKYSFEILAKDIDGNSVETERYSQIKVEGIVFKDGVVYLKNGNEEFALMNVKEIYEKEPPVPAEETQTAQSNLYRYINRL
ncbi:MAG: hypothetical protein A2161_04370 [Candidatus Schekmanbacteria bacterium RBG_13_48_7]|uniref:Basal-body rod modification protein FlgD n=1 Tax=Candidatus Schekmanbacteria bacterium RBG_13_48_7 TaxID=1817878 RepID=A0A1F7RSJ9_9BACT|nr:MAG: hypothetical protein A2161_04370 [Candidatus Schekmanbacteria bacterium RBG_13_48_7]